MNAASRLRMDATVTRMMYLFRFVFSPMYASFQMQ